MCLKLSIPNGYLYYAVNAFIRNISNANIRVLPN